MQSGEEIQLNTWPLHAVGGFCVDIKLFTELEGCLRECIQDRGKCTMLTVAFNPLAIGFSTLKLNESCQPKIKIVFHHTA